MAEKAKEAEEAEVFNENGIFWAAIVFLFEIISLLSFFRNYEHAVEQPQ